MNQSTLQDDCIPHSGRMYNYWLGGTYNNEVDRAAADAWRSQNPEVVHTARASREFLIRAVRFLVQDAGVRQLLDVGAGFPLDGGRNTHEVARRAAAGARVVYVDDDRAVLDAYAQKLVAERSTGEEVGLALADLHDPKSVLTAAAKTLDLTRPVAVMFMGVLGHTKNPLDALEVLRATLTALPSGSYLVAWDDCMNDDGRRQASAASEETDADAAYFPRTHEQIVEYFSGLDLIEPGVVPIIAWRPDSNTSGIASGVVARGGVAQRP